MLRLIIFLLFLIASVWFGIEVARHPGYLLIVYQPWMVQMPVWFALLAVVAFLLVFYLLIDSIDRVHLLGYRLKNWLRFRREHQFYSKTQQGLTALIEGRFKKSERLLLGGINQTVEPLINYLAAAHAAQQQGALTRRDNYIQMAYKVAPKADIAIGLTQAELEFEQNQYSHAVATLTHLREVSPRHPRVLKLLEKIYVRIADWNSLQLLLPYLYKSKLINAEELIQFEKNMYCERLHRNAPATLEACQREWHDLPRSVKKNPDAITAYVKQLLRFPSTNKEVEELVRKVIKHHWQPELVLIYSELPFANLNRQLVIASAWLKMYGEHQELFLLLGKLCVQVQLWGKAKDYFTKCLSLEPNAQASLALGKLLTQLSDEQGALRVYRAALEAGS